MSFDIVVKFCLCECQELEVPNLCRRESSGLREYYFMGKVKAATEESIHVHISKRQIRTHKEIFPVLGTCLEVENVIIIVRYS